MEKEMQLTKEQVKDTNKRLGSTPQWETTFYVARRHETISRSCMRSVGNWQAI